MNDRVLFHAEKEPALQKKRLNLKLLVNWILQIKLTVATNVHNKKMNRNQISSRVNEGL